MPNIAAIIAGELAALAADAQKLGTRLSTGDVVEAMVLPSNGLTDLLDIGGLRVAAELPPTLLPGETIVVRVMGFTDDRINLQIISTPENPGAEREAAGPRPPALTPALRSAAARAVRDVQATAARSASASSFTGEHVRAGNGPAAAAGSAAARNAPAAPAREPESAARVPAPARAPAQEPAARVPAPASAARLTAARPALLLPAALKPIEARLATAHAIAAPVTRPGDLGAKTLSPGGAGRMLAPAPPAVPRPPTAAAPRGLTALTSHDAPAAGATTAPPAPRGLAAFTEPVALLRSLHLAVTATNVASARMALEEPDRLPNALATLERALANSADPRVATLSTLTSFLARLDPRSPVFASQIGAFVDHVVTGGEAKIAELAHASDAAAPAAANPIGPPRISPEPARPEAKASPPATERVAVARAALDYDLKTQLLAFAADEAGHANSATPKTASINGAVAGVLTAITAFQLNAAATLDAHPGGLAFTVPIALPDGVAHARISIDHDAPKGKQTPPDGDNFHIAFVLETRHFGTVGIDVVTVGRAVTLRVKTEAEPARRVFGGALGELTARLTKLRYQVAKADAVVAPLPADPTGQPSPRPDAGPARLVDIDA